MVPAAQPDRKTIRCQKGGNLSQGRERRGNVGVLSVIQVGSAGATGVGGNRSRRTGAVGQPVVVSDDANCHPAVERIQERRKKGKGLRPAGLGCAALSGGVGWGDQSYA